MNRHQTSEAPHGRDGFTLIEMLVVTAVIALLAAMIFPITGAVNKLKIKTKTRAEMEQIATAIESCKTKRGSYPPDNPGNPLINPLYYELSGTTLTNNNYVTLDGFSVIPTNILGSASNPFGVDSTGQPYVGGFANSSAGAFGDEGVTAINFLSPPLKPNQVGVISFPHAQLTVLVSSIPWPANLKPAPIPNTQLNPWRYNFSHPTNNPTTYDLWIDIPIGGKLVRFSNWSRDPINL